MKRCMCAFVCACVCLSVYVYVHVWKREEVEVCEYTHFAVKFPVRGKIHPGSHIFLSASALTKTRF